MEDKFCAYKRVGYFRDKMAEDLGVKFTGTIYASKEAIKHIIKRHGRHLSKKISKNLIEYMKVIIDNPDYIGIYKKTKYGIYIELIKKIDGNILIGVDISNSKEYISVSTMYPVTQEKINNKLNTGELIKWIN